MPFIDVSDRGMNYITLRQLINDYIITMDGEDYASNASDAAIRNIALRGIREFGFDVTSRIKSIKRSVSSNNTITLPEDYVDIVKLGVVDDNGVVRAFAENKNINISQKLVDPLSTSESSDIGTDDFTNTGNRRVLSDNNINDREDDQTSTVSDGNNDDLDFYIFENYLYQGGLGRLYGLGGGKLRGNYRINYDQNRIEIDSEAGVTEVVLEYISDAARSSDPVVHVYAEEALRAYVYYKIVERKSSVPAGEKQRASAEYYNERRKARIRLSNFSKEQALNTIRKNFKLAPKY